MREEIAAEEVLRRLQSSQRPRAIGQREMGGVALITAILVVALATTAAIAMVSRQQFDVRRTANMLSLEQGLLYQQGIEGWSMQILRRDRKNNATDSLSDDWATLLPPLPVDEGMIAGRVVDLQGGFNLNSLWHDGKVDELALARFKRLMMVVGVEELPASSVIDWIDTDINPTLPDGAEDDLYLGAPLHRRSANRFMESRSELLLLARMNAKEGAERAARQARTSVVRMGWSSGGDAYGRPASGCAQGRGSDRCRSP